MIALINEIISNRTLLIVGAWYGLPITVALIVLFLIKSSRDERGRAIIGKASIIAMIVFILLVNGFAKLSSHITVNYITTACCIQWIYDIVLTVEVDAILIYKKLE